MFFPQKIKNIRPGDRVLEIGPGSDPHPRSDVLLELKYGTDEDRKAQFGHGTGLQSDKKIVFYDGTIFPFADQSFEYVICSHVLEHVDNVEFFLKEIFRVASKGYMEYPLAYYEYLYNFDVHLNLLKFDQGILYCLKKEDTRLNDFKEIQSFYLNALRNGHSSHIDNLLPLMMEGFEWEHDFKVKRTEVLSDVLWKAYEIPALPQPSEKEFSAYHHFKAMIRKLLHLN
jgi:SAM-dependent methyltransferase